jgi:hypothetical protein
VVACEALVPSESYTLKAEYLNLDRSLANSNFQSQHIPQSWRMFLKSADYQLSPDLLKDVYGAWRFWRRETDRSRRVFRLVMANWVAYLDLPPDQRPDSDPSVATNDFYSFGPDAPAKARVLSPEALARWLGTTSDVQELLKICDGRFVRIKEHADHRALVILLGTQLYRRDHGSDPPEPEALVGPYLKRLPADFPEDGKGETITGPSRKEIGTGQNPN